MYIFKAGYECLVRDFLRSSNPNRHFFTPRFLILILSNQDYTSTVRDLVLTTTHLHRAPPTSPKYALHRSETIVDRFLLPDSKTMTRAGAFSGFRSGSSVSSGSSKGAEAQLISQATSTAIVAAKSILMSGGSEDVALKTAKAAAESVLNPSKTVVDGATVISVRTPTGFLRRRKAKRQAEVVASMALVTAVNNIRTGQSSDWSSGSHMNPYTRNIVTQSMDEPSVLSGGTRPPMGPPQSQSLLSRTVNPQNFVLTESSVKVNGASPPPPPPPLPAGPPLRAHVSSLSKYSATGARANSENTPRNADVPSENINPSITSKNPYDKEKMSKSEKKACPLDTPLFVDDQKEAPSATEGDFDDETTLDPSVWTNARNNPWKDFDPLTDVFNLLTCGPILSRQSHTSTNFAVPKRIAHHAYHTDYETIASGIETMFTRDDAGTDFHTLDSYDQRDMKDHQLGGRSGSSSESTVDSFSVLREAQSNDASEGHIQVRSSIRDTMEKMISKHQKGLDSDRQKDQQWRSYEGRQAAHPGTPSSDAKKKPLQAFAITPKGVKKPFYFNNKRGLKK